MGFVLMIFLSLLGSVVEGSRYEQWPDMLVNPIVDYKGIHASAVNLRWLNLGLVVENQTGHYSNRVQDLSEQLYHYVVSSTPWGSNLSKAVVLEVGSGRGAGTVYIAHKFRPKKVIGVDFSEAAVAKSRIRYKETLAGEGWNFGWMIHKS